LFKGVALLAAFVSLAGLAEAQVRAPYVYQVLPYSMVQPSGPFAGTVASKTGCTGSGCSNFTLTPNNFTPQPQVGGLVGSLDASVATALSVIPLASNASGVIEEVDPTTGIKLPASSSLGPIFTERGETVGKHKFYIGLSTQSFHFTSFNGQSVKGIQLLDRGGESTNIPQIQGGLSPALTYDIGLDVRLSHNVAFLTYGVTGRFDVSVGLPVVHAAVSANGFNEEIYGGNGFGASGSYCWCQGTLTPSLAPGTPTAPTASGLVQPQVNFSALGKTGFGDMLLRFKGSAIEKPKAALALGVDLRLPTGDAKNFLGTGALAVKPFAALSLYTKPWNNGIVISPHINVGWQFAGQSLLGGQITSSTTTITVPNCQAGTASTCQTTEFAPPFASTKGYLPDVFSWAIGTEIALGPQNTVVVDFLGNQIGWIHGIPNMTTQSTSAQVPLPTTNATPTLTTATGFVGVPSQSFGQYSGAFGYKARIAGNLVATFDALVRFDNNGLTARVTPLVGLSYTF